MAADAILKNRQITGLDIKANEVSFPVNSGITHVIE